MKYQKPQKRALPVDDQATICLTDGKVGVTRITCNDTFQRAKNHAWTVCFVKDVEDIVEAIHLLQEKSSFR